MQPISIPPRPILRQMLRAVLPTDSDFGAFCIDFFPEAAARFSNSMDRVAKASLLLELADGLALVSALQQHDPQRLAHHERQIKAPPLQTNPYRGLAVFQIDEAHLFFGREALTGQLWQRFEALCEKPDTTRLLAIVGPSGSGKSSVGRAGLLASANDADAAAAAHARGPIAEAPTVAIGGRNCDDNCSHVPAVRAAADLPSL